MSARIVYRYALPNVDVIRIKVPVGSRPVLFDEQHGGLQVWIDRPVDQTLPTETHEFIVRGTGHDYSSVGWRHIGSALVEDGTYVFHLYGRTV